MTAVECLRNVFFYLNDFLGMTSPLLCAWSPIECRLMLRRSLTTNTRVPNLCMDIIGLRLEQKIYTKSAMNIHLLSPIPAY